MGWGVGELTAILQCIQFTNAVGKIVDSSNFFHFQAVTAIIDVR
jgi:hypothetical protein